MDAVHNDVTILAQGKEVPMTTGQAIVDKLAGGKALTMDEIAQAVMVDIKCTRNAVRKALNRLVASGKVTAHPKNDRVYTETDVIYHLLDATKDVSEAASI